MNKFQEQVKEFHETFDVPIHDKPLCSIAKDRALLRARLIFEEAKETIEGMGCYVGNDLVTRVQTVGIDDEMSFDMVEVADGLADLIYVVMGAALEFGIDLGQVFKEVHRSNMSKAWSTEEVEKGLPEGVSAHEIEGLFPMWCVKREDGKILKSPSYSPANIRKVLDDLSK